MTHRILTTTGGTIHPMYAAKGRPMEKVLRSA